VLQLGGRDAAAYAALLAAHEVDIVHAHHSLFGSAVAAAQGIPFVQTLHNTYHWFYPEEIDAWRAGDPHTSAYIHVSANVALFAHEKLGLSPSKSLVVENGVALPGERPGQPSVGPAREGDQRVFLAESSAAPRARLAASLGIDEHAFVFLQVASIYPPKCQLEAVRALALSRADDDRIVVVFLGRVMNERYRRQLEETIDRLGLADAVRFPGYREDVEDFYALADAFLLPSYWEGCSLAVAEALVRDLPCVLSDVGAARQQLRSGEGLLVAPPGPAVTGLDFGNLSAHLAEPREGFAAELAAAMVATAARGSGTRLPPDPARAARFDFETVADRYAGILGWLAQGGRAAQARPFTRGRVRR
jgi:glycosyltransferase involved in cell wall biosynthesis